MKTILEHELGHSNIGLGIAENADAAYLKMRAATCKELIDDANRTIEQFTKKLRREPGQGLAHRRS
jgi:hypothetical protein